MKNTEDNNLISPEEIKKEINDLVVNLFDNSDLETLTGTLEEGIGDEISKSIDSQIKIHDQLIQRANDRMEGIEPGEPDYLDLAKARDGLRKDQQELNKIKDSFDRFKHDIDPKNGVIPIGGFGSNYAASARVGEFSKELTGKGEKGFFSKLGAAFRSVFSSPNDETIDQEKSRFTKFVDRVKRSVTASRKEMEDLIGKDELPDVQLKGDLEVGKEQQNELPDLGPEIFKDLKVPLTPDQEQQVDKNKLQQEAKAEAQKAPSQEPIANMEKSGAEVSAPSTTTSGVENASIPGSPPNNTPPKKGPPPPPGAAPPPMGAPNAKNDVGKAPPKKGGPPPPPGGAPKANEKPSGAAAGGDLLSDLKNAKLKRVSVPEVVKKEENMGFNTDLLEAQQEVERENDFNSDDAWDDNDKEYQAELEAQIEIEKQKLAEKQAEEKAVVEAKPAMTENKKENIKEAETKEEPKKDNKEQEEAQKKASEVSKRLQSNVSKGGSFLDDIKNRKAGNAISSADIDTKLAKSDPKLSSDGFQYIPAPKKEEGPAGDIKSAFAGMQKAVRGVEDQVTSAFEGKTPSQKENIVYSAVIDGNDDFVSHIAREELISDEKLKKIGKAALKVASDKTISKDKRSAIKASVESLADDLGTDIKLDKPKGHAR